MRLKRCCFKASEKNAMLIFCMYMGSYTNEPDDLKICDFVDFSIYKLHALTFSWTMLPVENVKLYIFFNVDRKF